MLPRSRHMVPMMRRTFGVRLIQHQIPKKQIQFGLIKKRPFSIYSFGKFAGRVVKAPAAVGGGLAAAGSYVAYKVEQASSYTRDQVDRAKDLAGGLYDNISGFFGKFGGNGSEGVPPDGNGSNAAALGGTAAAVGFKSDDDEEEETLYLDEDEDEDEEEEDSETMDDEMLNLTRQMIEIRSILQSIDPNDNTLKLPSIVVIGSQSSGKSSVLEAVVGREFLPKGSNMVTRRPIELTLVNSPDLAAEVAEFPALRMNNLTDFEQVQKILYDLNLAVPITEAISNDPIQLTIRSPRVPDLSLVDLPGYIQVEAADQPTELKRKIRQLCDKYLEEPNIILAISAADVDLANSTALRASRQMDPKGERTIGVVTKLDLVDGAEARGILTNRKYPLKMGYVGVVTKVPQTSIFKKKTGYQAFIAQQNFESSFLKDNKDEFAGTSVGTRTLKKRLMRVLERSMALSLKPTYDRVQQELEEASYKFKVEFNDRSLTPETYIASSIDTLKGAVKEFSERFGRNEIKSVLKNELDQKVLDLLASKYWNKPHDQSREIDQDLRDIVNASPTDVYWHRKLDLTTNSLTKLGVGRLSTTLLTNALLTEIDNMIDNTTLRTHPMIKQVVRDAAEEVLNSRYYSTADQVENCIKPFKFEIELENSEWKQSREHIIRLLNEELRSCDQYLQLLKKNIGSRKLTQIMTYLENKDNSIGETIERENIGFSPGILSRGRDALFLKDRSSLLQFRISCLKSSQCKIKENKYKCPEIFLAAVADKLTQTAVLFLNVELLSDFYYNFPRALDAKLSNGLTQEQIEAFAKEDPKVKRHIELQQRKELLELATSKIEDVMTLQKHRTKH
ncbi:BA75_05054T0 [Komagataella pastoris]|uniref:dynamin GTPase n=1 Tax=Komagataella pastoris TaxID=4922 RepID=A0A1B2JJ71_PICPA|nr:BA75_05054T0 [Komagataella pastoris]